MRCGYRWYRRLQEAIVELFLEQVLLNVGFLRLRIMIGRSRRSRCSASICTAQFNLKVLIFYYFDVFPVYPFRPRSQVRAHMNHLPLLSLWNVAFTGWPRLSQRLRQNKMPNRQNMPACFRNRVILNAPPLRFVKSRLEEQGRRNNRGHYTTHRVLLHAPPAKSNLRISAHVCCRHEAAPVSCEC